MELREVLVPAAVLGPAAAAVVWMALAWWPWPRRVAAGAVWIASQVAVWVVLWEVFRGQGAAWMGLSPDLLRATLAAVAGAAVTLVLPRVEVLPPRAASAAVVAAGAALSAVVAAAYASSLVALAVLVPVPTLAVGLTGVVGDRARNLPGLIGLAAADAAVLAGLALLLDRSGTTVLAAVDAEALAVMLLLGGAALKLGAVPHVATWRVAASESFAAPVAVVIRAQGAVLAAVAAFTIAEVSSSTPLAAAAAGLTLLAGLAALAAATPGGVLTAVAGAGAAALFVPLGLGGGVGARAALLLLPAFVLAAGVVAASAWPGGGDPHDPRPGWRWAGALALGVGVASLVGLPPAGGFPGRWLSLSLTTNRGVVDPWYFVLLLMVVAGLVLAALAAVPAIRVARTRPAAAVLASLGAVALLYAGAQPLRLGIGWLLRVERELGLPEVLPSAGAPALPPIGGVDLAWAVLPALAIAAAAVVLGHPADPVGSLVGARGCRRRSTLPGGLLDRSPDRGGGDRGGRLDRAAGDGPRLPLRGPRAAIFAKGVEIAGAWVHSDPWRPVRFPRSPRGSTRRSASPRDR